MKKAVGIFTLFCLCSFFTIAQRMSKPDIRKLEDADIDFEIGDYKSALEAYSSLLERNSELELDFRIGVCYFNLRRHQEALPYFEKAKDKGEIEAYYYLGKTYHLEGRLDEEILLFQTYKNHENEIEQPIEEVRRLLDQAKLAKEMIDNPVNVDITNIGGPINTEYHEYVPLVYGVEEELYFTSRRPGSTGELLDQRGEHFEDVYVSKLEHGNWKEPVQLGSQINTPTHDACVGISSDGQVLYIFRTSEDLVHGDLYQSEMGLDGWEKLNKLSSDINSEYIETSASISSDDRIIYFSSNREGGFGGMDIYRSVKLPTGEWSKSQNLGPTINTAYDEDCPFIHADNKTLYFSSKGHKSMGGYDIFKSELRADGLWTEPLNLGYPINSVTHDLSFVMSSDKQTGYYSSAQEGGIGGLDIYKINFKLQAQILSVVKGGVASNDTSHVPVEAKITLINAQTKTIQGIYKSSHKNGRFIMLISPETSYDVIVEAEGYHTFSKNIFFDATVGFGSIIEEFKLVPLDLVITEINE